MQKNKLELREYQTRSLTMLYDWMERNSGNPCVSLPTGSGKSVVIAELCRQAVTEWPETKILMLTRSKELIEQNYAKLKAIWPNAPVGIYSASVGRKELGEPITIAGPLSIIKRLDQIGHTDLLICDECHDISHKDEGSYRKIISKLLEINPNMRVIGYTASPFRMGHGYITDKPAIFDALIEPVSIEELVYKGFLSTLRSKLPKFKISTEGVKKRGGEYIESDLQKAVDTKDNNESMVNEIIEKASDRKCWMVFCTGVAHAQNISDLLNEKGIAAIAVTGDMPKIEREKAIEDFKSGKIKAVTNVNCLSTGFDHGAIDLLVMARPTCSPGVYLQQGGRGMRPHTGKTDCLVLDFAGVVATHGPITAVQPPKKGGDGNGEAPVKVCDNCGELVHISADICSACGHPFPEAERKKLVLRDDDIMGLEGKDMEVKSWTWRKHVSKASGKEMLAVTYYGGLSDPAITEYLPLMHEGYAGQMAMLKLVDMAQRAQIESGGLHVHSLEQMVIKMNRTFAPIKIEYKKDGNFFRVIKRIWT